MELTVERIVLDSEPFHKDSSTMDRGYVIYRGILSELEAL